MTEAVTLVHDTFFYRPDKNMNAILNKRVGKDAGYDLYATKDIWFFPFQTRVVATNTHIHIPEGHFGCLTSRSGQAKRGWLTHAGTIDRGYTGNIGATQTNLSLLPRRVKKGERIAQIIFIPFTAVRPIEMDNYHDFAAYVKVKSKSDRGNKAYNSSGKY